MRVEVAHQLGKDAAMPVMDRCLDHILGGVGGSSIQIVDKQQTWTASQMRFSFTGRMGYISVPLAGTIDVYDANVIVDMELPPLVKTFIGEEKIRRIVEANVREMLTA
ncbi:MAG TPA: hypothetical protein VHA14_03960 [Bryobacteraceae bacterium]|nr:hypothetical protein [Bryobacteraceae bacterium]